MPKHYCGVSWHIYKGTLNALAAIPGCVIVSENGLEFGKPVSDLFSHIEKFAEDAIVSDSALVSTLFHYDTWSFMQLFRAVRDYEKHPMDPHDDQLCLDGSIGRSISARLHVSASIAIGLLCKKVLRTTEDVNRVVDYFTKGVMQAESVLQRHYAAESIRFHSSDTDQLVPGDHYFMGIIALDTWKTRVSIAVANAVNVVYKDEFAAIIGRSKLVAVVQSFEQLSATHNY